MAGFEWVNNGSVQDLSKTALPPGLNPVSALAPTSQAGGNMLAWEGNENAMTAPGSQPVDNLNKHVQQNVENPDIEVSNKSAFPTGTDGKPQASGQTGTAPRGGATWKRTSRPNVTRTPVSQIGTSAEVGS